MSVITEVMTYIENLGAGHDVNTAFYNNDTSSLTSGTDLFGLRTPDSPKNVVVVLSLGGRQPDKRREAVYPGFIISVRHEYPERAYNTANNFIKLLHKNTDVFSVPGIIYGLNSQPHSVYISPDSLQCFVSSFIVLLQKAV